MLDQGFTRDNFRKIYAKEKRKGKPLEDLFFPKLRSITDEIVKVNALIKVAKKDKLTTINTLYDQRIELKQQKEITLLQELENIAKSLKITAARDFRINQIGSISEKPIYGLEQRPETFFSEKQVQYNLKKLFKIKFSNRHTILSQLKPIFNNSLPLIVVRLDIKNFYESISHELLSNRITKNNLLTWTSRSAINQIVNSYKEITSKDTGLPRGIGLSAYLAELYVRDIDTKMKRLSNIIFYARYVDDIIAVFCHTSTSSIDYCKTEMIKIICSEDYQLSNNEQKQQIELINQSKDVEIDYLGYRISIKKESKAIFSFTNSKVNKYKKRIVLSIQDFLSTNKYNRKKATKLLKSRLSFLTGNTKLVNAKENVLIGIFYSNRLINDMKQLEELDLYLYDQLAKVYEGDKLNRVIKKYSFTKGFQNKTYHHFTQNQLKNIVRLWHINSEVEIKSLYNSKLRII